MKNFNPLIAACFVMLASQIAFAAEPSATQQPAVEQYTYNTPLTITKVLRMDPIPTDTCAVVPLKMTYLDDRNQVHTLQYLVQGNGCTLK